MTRCAITKNGLTIEKGMEKSPYLKAFQTSINYVKGKTNVFDELINSKIVTKIHEYYSGYLLRIIKERTTKESSI